MRGREQGSIEYVVADGSLRRKEGGNYRWDHWMEEETTDGIIGWRRRLHLMEMNKAQIIAYHMDMIYRKTNVRVLLTVKDQCKGITSGERPM